MKKLFYTYILANIATGQTYENGKNSPLSILSKIKPSHQTPKKIIVDFDPAWVDSLHLLLPCKNVPVPKRTMRLPNAPRTYRSGIHRGIDFLRIGVLQLMQLHLEQLFVLIIIIKKSQPILE